MAVTFPANFSLTNLQRRLEPGIVYVCGSCRLPIGDHNDWSSDHVGDNVILMKAVSQFVKSGKLTTSSDPGDAGSQYQPLSCNSCHNVLGKFYSSTPANLNYKLNLYNIDKNVIDRYKFGEKLQQIIPASEAPITLKQCHFYEEEFQKQNLLLGMLLKRLSRLEDEVFTTSVQDSS